MSSQDSYNRYLDSQVERALQACLEIEDTWLRSIGAPVRRLPQHIAQVVSMRMMLAIDPELSRYLVQQTWLRKTLDEALELRRTRIQKERG